MCFIKAEDKSKVSQKDKVQCRTKVMKLNSAGLIMRFSYFSTQRNSRPEVFLKIRQISLENICVGVFLENFLKNRLQRRSFPVKPAKILRRPFFKEHLGWLLLESVNQSKFKCEYEGTNWESVR